jgi:UDP-N-acetylglucosamine 2-epimerase
MFSQPVVRQTGLRPTIHRFPVALDMKIATIVGARPQFIKAGPISKALQTAGMVEYLIHTGQHYDYGMSQVFFEELELPEPNINLAIGSGPHGRQTGQMLAKIEEVLLAQKPDWVLVFGDTNSTLAGALAASKLHILVAHVEAGLRSFKRAMPEEINRVVTDHLSELLFCPSDNAVKNLAQEGISKGVHIVGDVMADALHHAATLAPKKSRILDNLRLLPKRYCLATVHRAENTDNPQRLAGILCALSRIAKTESVVFPVHPRTRKRLADMTHPEGCGYTMPSTLRLIDPVGYLDMVQLTQNSRCVLTDSGGLQKEAYWLGVPCVTLREETEWIETTQNGWNRLVGCNTERIVSAAQSDDWPDDRPPLYGNGNAALCIASLLLC